MSNVTIDKIQIEIEASAGKADKAIKVLETNLKTLRSALSGFNTSGIDNVTNSLNKAATAAENLNKNPISPKVNTSGISSAEKKISNELNKIKDKFTRLSSLEIAAKGGDSSALTSWKRLATSLQGDIDVLDSKMKRIGFVPSDAWNNLIEKEKEVDSRLTTLKAKMESVISGKTVMSDNSFKQLSEDIANARGELQQISDLQSQMRQEGTNKVDPISGLREGLVGVQSDLDSARDRMQGFGQASGEASSSFDATQIISMLKQVAAQTTRVIKKMLQLVGGAIKKGFQALAGAIGKVKDALTGTGKASDKFNKFMNKGFMRILKYGFGIRSLYVGFRRLRKAVVESFGELQKSGAFYETTRANIEALKKSLTLLKYQFGAAFEPIFNAVAPALRVFIDHVLKAMNAFSAFTAKLMGKDSYSRAVISTQAVEDNVSGAAKAAKDLKKQLQGFDELNNLTSSTPNSGNGSGSGDDDSLSVTYVSESVDNVLGDFGKTLADLIKKGDWGGVGTAISEKLTAVLKDLNSKWPEIFEKAADFGTKLAEFFEGLITPELFGEIGKALGNALKAALTLTFNFAKTMSEVITEGENKGKTGWQVLGESIAAGINEFVKTNPLKLVVANFNEWANGILTALITAIDGIEWDTVAQHIADAIADIDASGIGWKLGKLANSLANAFYTLVSKKETWTNLGQKIADGINNFFSGMSEIDPKTGLSGWQALGKSISETLVGIATAITKALEEVDWEEVGQGIADFIASIDWTQIKWALGALGTAFKEALKGLLKGLDIDASDIVIALAGVGLVVQSIAGISLASTITKVALSAMIKNAITGLFAGGSGAAAGGAAAGATAGGASTVLVALGEVFSVAATVAGVALSFAASAAIGFKFGNTFGEFIAYWLKDHGIISSETADEYYEIAEEMSFTQKVKDIFLAAGEKTAGGENRLKKAFEDMVYDWYEPVFEEGVQITASVKELVLDVKDFAVSIGGKIKTAAEIWNDFWGDVGEAAFDKTVSIKMAFEDTVESFKQKWDDFKSKLSENDIVLGVKTKFEETKESIKAKWEDIKKKTGDVLLDVKSKISATVNSDEVKTLKDTITSKFKKFTISPKIKTPKNKAFNAITKKIREWKKGLYGKGVTLMHLPLSIDVSSNLNNIGDWIDSHIIDPINQQMETVSRRTKTTYKRIQYVKRRVGAEEGGALYGGVWHNIPQYARGTVDAFKHGSVFVAGEKGPEVAGHINGRTEILNKSQLASIMYTSITRGMAQFRNAKVTQPPKPEYIGGIANAMVEGITRSSDNTSIAEQNRLLQEQNEYLRIIAEKEFSVSSRDVFKATRKEAQNFNNRTGVSPFVF